MQPAAAERAVGREHLAQVLTTAWLRGAALYLPVEQLAAGRTHDRTRRARRPFPACR